MEHFAAYLALDWSDEKHDVALFDPSADRREAYTIKHSAQAIEEWATALRKRFAGQKIAVCLEQSRGPLIYALLKYDFLVLFPIKREDSCQIPRGLLSEWGERRSARYRLPT